MFTAEGLARWVALGAADLEGGKVIVRGDGQYARAAIESVSVDGTQATVRAVFGEQEANFEWTERLIVNVEGTIIDAETQDLGRKAGGSVWTLEVVLELAPNANVD